MCLYFIAPPSNDTKFLYDHKSRNGWNVHFLLQKCYFSMVNDDTEEFVSVVIVFNQHVVGGNVRDVVFVHATQKI